MTAAVPPPADDQAARADNDMFGTTCAECGGPITDERPSVGEAPDGSGPMHAGCGEPCVCGTKFTCCAHDHEDEPVGPAEAAEPTPHRVLVHGENDRSEWMDCDGEGCHECSSPVLVAYCDNVDDESGSSCHGWQRFRWGMSEAACNKCGGRCGIAVAQWARVDPPRHVEPAQPNADGHYDLDDVLREAGIDPAEAGAPEPAAPEPGYPRIADAIHAACEAADIDLTVVHDGRVLDYVPGVVWLATVLDKAGLIDWAAFAEGAGSVSTTPDDDTVSIATDDLVDALYDVFPAVVTFPRDALEKAVRAALAGSATPAAGEWEQAMRGFLGKHVEVVLQREPRKTCVGVLHEFDYHGQARLAQDDGTWTWCWPALGIDLAPAEPAPAPADPALIGTYADPEFRAHQDHKHPVDGCGYCPSEEDR